MKLNQSCKIVLVALLAAQNIWAAAPTNSAAAAAAPAAAPAPVDYSTFATFIADRNIFDPNRIQHRPWVQQTNPPPRPPQRPQPASLSLVGIVGYSEGKLAGAYAFFDGTSQQYRKTVKLNGDIAVFKVSDIAADSVTLTTGTNSHTVLKLGEQLHDSGGGHWVTENGTDVRYNTSANSRFNSRSGYQNGNNRGGRQRNNNFGGGNQGNYNYNNAGGFTQGRNNFNGGQTFDNSQTQQDPNAGAQDFNVAPGGMTPQDFNAQQIFIAPPDLNPPADPGQQDN